MIKRSITVIAFALLFAITGILFSQPLTRVSGAALDQQEVSGMTCRIDSTLEGGQL